MKVGLPIQYQHLSSDERFRLALAADERGDKPEVLRLTASGPRVQLTGPEHALNMMSWISLSHHAYIELIEQASLFHNAYDFACRSDDEAEGDDALPQCWERVFFFGCLLRTKYFGWLRFCKRIGVPPLWQWRDLPGYWRLELALKFSKNKAFTPMGFMRTLNRKRPEGSAPKTKPPLTTKGIAREFYRLYLKGIPT